MCWRRWWIKEFVIGEGVSGEWSSGVRGEEHNCEELDFGLHGRWNDDSIFRWSVS